MYFVYLQLFYFLTTNVQIIQTQYYLYRCSLISMLKDEMFSYPISIAILYYSSDAKDTKDTEIFVKSLSDTLKKLGHMVRVVQVTHRNWLKTVGTPGDVVFNLVEDEKYELYVKVANKLSMMGRTQVGMGPEGMKYIVRKAQIKRKMHSENISTPKFRILNKRSNPETIKSMKFPLIVKPSGQHAGVGINQDSVVIDKNELRERVNFLRKNYPGEVLVEEYIDGREIQVTVMGNGRKILMLPPAEVVFSGEFQDNWNVYTYEAKWEKTSWEYWDARIACPARMSIKLEKRIESLVTKAYRAFECRDIARFDLRVDEKDRVFIIDVNMSPGLNGLDDEEAAVRSAKAMGWTYPQLLERLVAIAYKRSYGSLPDRIRERQFLLNAPEI